MSEDKKLIKKAKAPNLTKETAKKVKGKLVLDLTTEKRSRVYYKNSIGTFELRKGKLFDSEGKPVSSKRIRQQGGDLKAIKE